MGQKIKLYVKEGNRYKEYQEPVCQDNKLYRKRGSKYEPVGMHVNSDMLTEGVWVVTHSKSSWSMTSGKYLKDIFQIDKLSNLEKLTIAQLGSLHQACNDAIYEVNTEGMSVYDALHARVAYIIDKLTKQ